MIDHIPSCAQLEKRPCPAKFSLQSEAPEDHWWSGWPGAYCLKCGAEDKNEVCIARGCECPCHEEFWAGYEQYLREEQVRKGILWYIEAALSWIACRIGHKLFPGPLPVEGPSSYCYWCGRHLTDRWPFSRFIT